jgi:hypothetical protein
MNVTVTAADCPPTSFSFTEAASRIEADQVLEVRRSGEASICPLFEPMGDSPVRARITLECFGDPATCPSVVVDRTRVTWPGTLRTGQTLTLEHGGKASLKPGENAEAVDVSADLEGQALLLRPRNVNRIIYRDRDPPSARPKVRINVEPMP